MLSESGVYGKRGAIPFFFEAPAFIVTSVMRSITFPKIGIRVMMNLNKLWKLIFGMIVMLMNFVEEKKIVI